MKLLTATTETQGHKPGDFNNCIDSEPVMFPAEYCKKDIFAPDPNTGGCGCGRSFTGLISGHRTTTAEIRDCDLGWHRLNALIMLSGCPDHLTRIVAKQLVETASKYDEGTIVGNHLGTIITRRKSDQGEIVL